MAAPKVRILIVDESPAVYETLRAILGRIPAPAALSASEEGVPGSFELDAAPKGAHALEKVIQAGLAERPYAIVFVDVRSPLGLEIIEHLWKVDAALQIVACAASFDFSWETVAARLGLHGDLLVLRKPFASLEVVQMAHTLAKKWLGARQGHLPPPAREHPGPPSTAASSPPEAPRDPGDKLEVVGQLAAGIAHSFNNLFTIIQGHASLQLASERHDPETTVAFREIASASERAAELTRQLLAFSQRQVMRPGVLHINQLLTDLADTLRRLIGERITLTLDLAEPLPPVWADGPGLERIIINLVRNARDATPQGGRICISTRAETLGPETTARHPDAAPGEYLRLTVSDTGMGMDAETREHIFEPFFTTKPADEGTGMGLSTVLGITRQHGGWIEVFAAPGEGAAFSVFLRATLRAPVPATTPILPPDDSAGERTILLVEDDEAVRSLVKEILEYEGYRVIEAASGDAALALWPQRGPEVDLLLTDMIMPGRTSGLELSRQLLGLKPSLRVIFTSGYSAELFGSDVSLVEGINYLPKPYLSHHLTNILHAALR